jgi:hypothetical protein
MASGESIYSYIIRLMMIDVDNTEFQADCAAVLLSYGTAGETR